MGNAGIKPALQCPANVAFSVKSDKTQLSKTGRLLASWPTCTPSTSATRHRAGTRSLRDISQSARCDVWCFQFGCEGRMPIRPLLEGAQVTTQSCASLLNAR